MITLDARKTIIKILSSLLSFVLFFIFNLLVLIILARMSISKDLIRDILKYEFEVGDITIKDTIADSSINKPSNLNPDDFVVSTDINNVSNSNTDNFLSDLQRILVDNDLPADLYKYVEDNEENLEIVVNIYDNIVAYAIGDEDELKFDRKDIKTLLNSAINNYEETTKTEINKEGMNGFLNDFETYYKSDMLRMNSDTRDLLNAILYGSIFVGIVVLNIIVLIILLVINYNNIGVLLNIFVPSMLTGITYIFVPIFVINNIENYEVIRVILDNSVSLGKYIAMVSSLGILLYIILRIRTKQKEESEEYA